MNRGMYIWLVLTAFVVLACEKVIDIPLNDADIRIVVDAQLRDSLGDNYVRLSRTGSVYDNANFEIISGATVTISDGATTYTLAEDPSEPGFYTNLALKSEPNMTYNLTIVTDGQTLTATSTTFDEPVISELFFEKQYNFFSEFDPSEPDSVFQVFYDFSDNGGQTNFYRVRAWVNGDEDRNFYVYNDKLFNGQNNIAPIWGSSVLAGDTVDVELLSIDEARYKYLVTLVSNLQSGGQGPTPANPTSNIEGDAIGYFSAFTIDTMRIIMPE